MGAKRKMYLKMVISSLSRRKSRMITALLAVAIGATILSGLVTIYYDIPRQLGKEFRSYGANMIVIPTDAQNRITESQLAEIRNVIPEKQLFGLSPYVYYNAQINTQPFIIAATDLEQSKKSYPYWLVHGRWPEQARETLIGIEVAKNIDAYEGDTIVVTAKRENGDEITREFVIAGTVTTGGKEDELIFISLEDMQSIAVIKGYDVVECSIEADQQELEELVAKMSHKDKALTPRTVRRVTQSQDIVLAKLQALVWIVTAVVLIIMMICVSTTMMAMITERRKEIGLKKALGASNKGVVLDFLGEGAMLGAFGGLLGSFLGYEFARQVSMSVFARTVHFMWILVPLTVVVSIVITVLACLIPVRKAIDVDPALVLRGE
ncbi:MAG: FtsX-like permease family protein [Bacillota bacterium]|nr:FtsX-like permease family protein [Bacillota bacterium]